MSSDEIGFILEHFDDKFDSLIEAFQVMSSLMARDSDLQEVKTEVKTIKQVVRATNKDVHRLEKRVDRIETHLGV